MPSLRSRIFLTLLRNRNLFRLRLRKDTGHDWDVKLPEVRRNAAKTSRLFGKPPQDIEMVPFHMGSMPARWIKPRNASSRGVSLHFHGGGYVLGTNAAHQGIVSKFARSAGLNTLLFAYRLAPEHPYPAALEDALSAYGWLLEQGTDPRDVVFMGESAGGGLCLATLVALRDKGLPLPKAAVVLSPWTDLQFTGDSYRTKAKICLSPVDSWWVCRKHYVVDKDPTDPYISPLYADLHGLPPLGIYAGEDEVFRDDAIRFAEKAAKAGVSVQLTVGEGMCHCYPACAPLFPEATQAMEEIGQFMRTRLDL